ncbi:MAG: anion permease, partial [Burkholderiales bacterium]|nr:anion permease [Burkholderiales bacterium]
MNSPPEHQDKVTPPHPAQGEGLQSAPGGPLTMQRLIVLVAGPVLTAVLLMLPAPEGMTPEAWRLVALASWMIIWWIGEAVPIPVTALLPIPMMPLLGIAAITPVSANYGHPLIFLFLGG